MFCLDSNEQFLICLKNKQAAAFQFFPVQAGEINGENVGGRGLLLNVLRKTGNRQNLPQRQMPVMILMPDVFYNPNRR